MPSIADVLSTTERGRIRPDADYPARYVSEQRCNTCKVIKGFEDFSRSKSTRRLASNCRDCENARSRKKYADTPEVVKATNKRWKDGNRAAVNAINRKYQKRHPEKKRAIDKRGYWRDVELSRLKGREYSHKWRLANPDKVADQNLKNRLIRFNLTVEEYWAFYDTQGGCCAICGREEGNARSLSVDHDHLCCDGDRSCGNCVRGLLCTMCNWGLGNFFDNSTSLLAAIGYLWRFTDGC